MSGTTNRDEYLFSAACAPPPQDIVLDPEFKNIRMVTPIGRLMYPTLAVPRASSFSPDPKFSCGIAMAPDFVSDLWKAICMVADARWPSETKPNPSNPNEMVQMTGSQILQYVAKEQGGLSNPLQKGDSAYMKDPAKNGHLRGLMTMNANIGSANKKTGQSQQPILLDEEGRPMKPELFYGGCYGRLQITLFAFPQPGQQIPNRGIGVLLNAVQFARHGEKLGGFDAMKAAKSAFGALPKSDTAAPSGAAAAGSPWMGGTGAATGGAFAAPAAGGNPFPPAG